MGNKAIPELGSDVMQQIYLCAINRYLMKRVAFW